jgi:hypothetical protein
MSLEYLKHIHTRRQKQLEKKARRAAKLEAEKEAIRISEMKAEALRQKENNKHKRLLIEQQENKRLRQKHIQRKEKLAEQKWNKQFDALMDKVERLQQENNKLEEIRTIIENREPSLQELDWDMWLSDPLNQRLADLDFEHAMMMFKHDNLMAKRLKPQRRGGTSGHPRKIDPTYFLSFTGDTQATARADLVRTDFTPNDPTNKGFAEGSGRKPLAESGFTISYWYRPDERTSDAFAMGWKREDNARFSFGMRNAARPYFGIGSNTFGTYGGHNSWVTMFTNSGFSAVNNIDDFLDGDSNLRLNQWYHIAITYVGSDNADETARYRRIYFNGKQIYGYNTEAIGTDYNDWFNVDRTGLISWPTTNLDARMSRGFSFGMRALKGTGTIVASDGATIRMSKYNNGHACGLDDVAIYNELKDNDWIRKVYAGKTDYNHKTSGGNGLVAYWKFNEGSGTTVKDLGPHGYHGTLTNAAVGEGDDITVQTAIGNIAEGTPVWNKTPTGYGK